MTVDKWDQRQLCPDGGCVGVIGMDGKCKVCGTAAPDWGDPRKPGRVSSKAEEDELDASADDAPAEAKPTAEERAKKTWTSRQLCSDGSCIGVIGPDGTCKVCGKAADGAVASDEEEDESEYEDEDDDEDDDDDDHDAESEEDDDADEIDDGGDGDDGEDEDEGDDDSDDDDDDEDDDESHDAEAAAADADQRTLCSDGACVGVIGDDGKCKVCGKAAA